MKFVKIGQKSLANRTQQSRDDNYASPAARFALRLTRACKHLLNKPDSHFWISRLKELLFSTTN